jgi:pimeloyl-ACP methyl ester carboxylesterase
MDRRHLLGQLGGSILAMTAALTGCATQASATKPRIVLIHGAWHGGWCWDQVAINLRAAGYIVSTPTLPAMAERKGEMSLSIDLDSHIAAAVNAAVALDGPVILLGHSYGGFVVTGAADRLLPMNKLASLIYLDAFVPTNGQVVVDYMLPDARAKLQASFAAGDPAYPAPPARFFGISDPQQLAYVESKVTAQPIGTYLQPLKLSGPWPARIPRAYIACNQPRIPVFDDIKRRLSIDPAWRYVELPTGHDAMIIAPALLSNTIISLTETIGRT